MTGTQFNFHVPAEIGVAMSVAQMYREGPGGIPVGPDGSLLGGHSADLCGTERALRDSALNFIRNYINGEQVVPRPCQCHGCVQQRAIEDVRASAEREVAAVLFPESKSGEAIGPPRVFDQAQLEEFLTQISMKTKPEGPSGNSDQPPTS